MNKEPFAPPLAVVLSAQEASFQAATFKGDLVQNLADIAAMGYDGVEIAIRDPRQVDGPAILALAREHGLEVPAIGTGQAWGEEGLSFTDPDPAVRKAAIERINSHAPLAAEADAVIILGLIRGILRPNVDHGQAMTWLVDALKACCNEAARLGARLVLEPIHRYETTLINNLEQGRELIEAVGADNLGMLADTFHMNIEEPSMEESLRATGSRVYHVHVADSNRWPPGGGHIDFSSILDTLDDMGYAGWVSGEFLPIPSAQVGAKKSIELLRGLLAA
jgi:5-keto-L-gluconate epimerase